MICYVNLTAWQVWGRLAYTCTVLSERWWMFSVCACACVSDCWALLWVPVGTFFFLLSVSFSEAKEKSYCPIHRNWRLALSNPRIFQLFNWSNILLIKWTQTMETAQKGKAQSCFSIFTVENWSVDTFWLPWTKMIFKRITRRIPSSKICSVYKLKSGA